MIPFAARWFSGIHKYDMLYPITGCQYAAFYNERADHDADGYDDRHQYDTDRNTIGF